MTLREIVHELRCQRDPLTYVRYRTGSALTIRANRWLDALRDARVVVRRRIRTTEKRALAQHPCFADCHLGKIRQYIAQTKFVYGLKETS